MRKLGEHGGRLIIRNLPYGLTLPQLTKLVSDIAEVKDVSMPWDEARQRNKGFAFVEYTKKNVSEKAIKVLNGKTVQHRVLAVDYAMSKTHYEKALKTEELTHAFKPKSLDPPPIPPDPPSEPVPLPTEPPSDPPIESSKPSQPPNRLYQNCTLFVKNLSYEIDDDDLTDYFSQFGPLRYAKIVYSNETNQSKGTGFVCFKHEKDAEKTLNSLGNSADPGVEMELEGRIPEVFMAVSRDEAGKIKPKSTVKDTRNLKLSKEGIIMPNSEVFQALSQEEIEKRVEYAREKNMKLKKNPNIFVSKTRVLMRNIPKAVDEKQLKATIRDFLLKFDPEIAKKKLFSQVKIVKDATRPDAEGNPRSKGFAFIDFKLHEKALFFIRKLSENPYLFSQKNALIAEFALDDIRMIRLRKLRLERQKRKLEELKTAENEERWGFDEEKEKKLGRGARQRMKKRMKKVQSEGNTENTENEVDLEELNTHLVAKKEKNSEKMTEKRDLEEKKEDFKQEKREKNSRKNEKNREKSRNRGKIRPAEDDIEVLEFSAPKKRRKDKKSTDEDAALERLVTDYRNKLFSGFT